MSTFAIFIEDSDAINKNRKYVESFLENAGLPLLACTGIEEAMENIRKQDVSGARPTLVLFGPNLENRVSAARQLYQEAPLAHFVFLVNSDDSALARQLNSPVARIGSYWSIIEPDSEQLDVRLHEAANSAQKRLQVRTTLNRINSQLSSHAQSDISELQRYAVSDRFLANILQHAYDAIIATDNEGIIITWNDAAHEMFGLTEDEATGLSIGEVTEGEWREQMPGILTEVRMSRNAYIRRELECERPDGHTLNVELTLSLVLHESGRPIGVSAVVRDITERKQTEKALRESEARYRTVAETASDGIVTIDSNSNILFFNPAAEKIFGYRADEVAGRKITMLMPEGLRERHSKSLKDYLETGQKHISWAGVELIGLHRNGSEMPLELSFGEFQRNGERLFTGIARDITERKKAEKALRESEEKLRAILDNSPAVIYMLDTENRYIFVNHRWEAVAGASRDGVLGKTPYDFWPKETAEAFVNTHQAILSGGNPIEQEEVVAQRGEPHTYLSSKFPLFDTSGSPYAVCGISTEITERKRAEEELEINRNRLSLAVEAAGLGIYEHAVPMDDTTYHSERWAQILGYELAELPPPAQRSRWVTQHAHPDDVSELNTGYEDFVEGQKEGLVTEIRMRHKTGDWVWARGYSRAMERNESGQVTRILGVAQDVTDQKRAYEQIRASLAQKEVLLKEVHHRVKNNLQIITSLISLQAQYVKDRDALQVFTDIRNRINSIALIHERLYRSKDLSRIDFAQYVKELSSDLIRSYRPYRAIIKVDIDIPQVFLNIDVAIPCGLIINELVSNSLKYAFPEDTNGEISISLRIEGYQMIMQVSDNGVGIPESLDIYNTDSLGLRLVKMLANQIGGTMEARRVNGTAIAITFESPDDYQGD